MRVLDKLAYGISERVNHKKGCRPKNSLQCSINRDQLDYLMRYYATKSYVEGFRLAFTEWNGETLTKYSAINDPVNIVVPKELNCTALSQDGIRRRIESHVEKLKK